MLLFRWHRHLGFMQFRQVVAQRLRFFAFAHAQNGVVRGFHPVVRHDDRTYAALTFLDSIYRFTFFIQQVRGNRDRHDSMHFFGVVFQRFFFNQAQNGQRQRFVITNSAGAATTWTDVVAGLAQGRAEALAGHLQQAKT